MKWTAYLKSTLMIHEIRVLTKVRIMFNLRIIFFMWTIWSSIVVTYGKCPFFQQVKTIQHQCLAHDLFSFIGMIPFRGLSKLKIFMPCKLVKKGLKKFQLPPDFLWQFHIGVPIVKYLLTKGMLFKFNIVNTLLKRKYFLFWIVLQYYLPGIYSCGTVKGNKKFLANLVKKTTF